LGIVQDERGAKALKDFFISRREEYYFVIEFASIYNRRWMLANNFFAPKEKEVFLEKTKELGIYQ
jgi:hypothetical protein